MRRIIGVFLGMVVLYGWHTEFAIQPYTGVLYLRVWSHAQHNPMSVCERGSVEVVVVVQSRTVSTPSPPSLDRTEPWGRNGSYVI